MTTKCEHCGTLFDEDDIHCPHCGAPVQKIIEAEVTSDYHCDYCGAPLEEDEEKCSHCGAEFKWFDDEKENNKTELRLNKKAAIAVIASVCIFCCLIVAFFPLEQTSILPENIYPHQSYYSPTVFVTQQGQNILITTSNITDHYLFCSTNASLAIKQAINYAVNGSIMIFSGTFKLDTTIIVDKPLTLLGQGSMLIGNSNMSSILRVVGNERVTVESFATRVG